MTTPDLTPPDSTFPVNQKKVLNGWAMFDWANSAFALVITVAIFPEYFNSMVDDELNVLGFKLKDTALFAYLVSLSYLLIALFSPYLSGIADAGGKRLAFLKTFTTVGAISCLCLFFFTGMETLWIGASCFVLSMVGFAGGLVFYNSFLPVIASEDRYDRISARGFALGFLGSVILLVFNLLMIQKPQWFGLPEGGTLAVQITFITVGLWWLGFAQIPFNRLPADKKQEVDLATLRKKGWQEIRKAASAVSERIHMKRFLSGFFFLSAGVQTILFLASTFAAVELGFETAELIQVILLLQILGIAGAYTFSFLSEKSGNKIALIVILCIWLIICVSGYFVQTKAPFYFIAGAVGFVMGGTQSLSRSTYAKLIPDVRESTSFYSFYDVLEKVAIVVGTLCFGILDNVTGSMRLSLLLLAFFFVISLTFIGRFKVVK
ncbi:MFS transporter [Lewinellaceae bacterium SD302]|nr:MFS transporter [Lewinellaceae bacterium SD302]